MAQIARASVLVSIAAAIASAAPAQAPGLAPKLEALAREGSAEAKYHLGMLYNNGIGVPADPRKAFQYFMAAAEAGDALGAYKVGCYHAGQFGDVVAVDEALALKFKLIAAEAGYMLAQVEVANIYLAREDYRSALPWLEAAARQGESKALYNLSVLYNDGLGVPKSPGRAAAFFRLAHLAAKGSVTPGAQRSLDEMERTMSPEERAISNSIGVDWITGRTEMTVLALSGQKRAEALVQGR